MVNLQVTSSNSFTASEPFVRSVARLAGEEASAPVLALVASDREVDLALREVDNTHADPALGAIALDVVDVVHVDELGVAACERKLAIAESRTDEKEEGKRGCERNDGDKREEEMRVVPLRPTLSPCFWTSNLAASSSFWIPNSRPCDGVTLMYLPSRPRMAILPVTFAFAVEAIGKAEAGRRGKGQSKWLWTIEQGGGPTC